MKDRPLSPREATVLHFIAWGYTHTEIAQHLGVSVKTVEAQKFNGMRKLGVTRRAEVVRYAVERGWLTLDAAPHLSGLRPEPTHASHN